MLAPEVFDRLYLSTEYDGLLDELAQDDPELQRMLTEMDEAAVEAHWLWWLDRNTNGFMWYEMGHDEPDTWACPECGEEIPFGDPCWTCLDQREQDYIAAREGSYWDA